jgi:hypothetical protein
MAGQTDDAAWDEIMVDIESALGKIMQHEDQGESRDRIIFTDREIEAIKMALVFIVQS